MQYAYRVRTIISVPQVIPNPEKHDQLHSRTFFQIRQQILRDFKPTYPITIYAIHNRSKQYSIPCERFTYVLYRELIDLRAVNHFVVHGHAPSGVSVPHFVSYKSSWNHCPRLCVNRATPYYSTESNGSPKYNDKQEKIITPSKYQKPIYSPEVEKPTFNATTTINSGLMEGMQHES